MTGLDRIREGMTAYLTENGLRAVSAYPAEPRKRREGPVAAVSIRGYEGGPAGFQDYLGDRFNTESGRWEELYGKRIRLTFGVDLYAEPEQGLALQQAVDTLAQALHGGGPAGLKPVELSMGEMAYDSGAGLLRLPAEVICEAYLYAAAEEGGEFLHFAVRGEKRE